MNRVRSSWERLAKPVKRIGYGLLVFISMIIVIGLLHAQTTSVGNESVVSIVAAGVKFFL